jgi:hypothetical protein
MEVKNLGRKYIWTPRCEIMNKWEKSIGITTQMKRLSIGNYSLIPSSNISPQVKNRFIFDAMQRWLGYNELRNNYRKQIWYSIVYGIIIILHSNQIDIQRNFHFLIVNAI